MPNPKTGTVTLDVARAVTEFKGGKVEYRTDRSGIIHLSIGKKSFTEEMLVENYGSVLDEIVRAVNEVGAAPGDLIAILEALKQAGALRAELEVI